MLLASGLCVGITIASAQETKSRAAKAREQNIADVRRMQALAKDVSASLEQTKHNVLSMGSLKSLDEIAKLSQTVRGRLKGK